MNSSPTRVLFCENGQHEFVVLKKRGPIPKNCADHKNKPKKPQTAVPKQQAMQEGRSRKAREDREKKIEDILTLPANARCTCGITSGITDAELVSLKSCTDPQFICPTLVRVRVAVGLHERKDTQ